MNTHSTPQTPAQLLAQSTTLEAVSAKFANRPMKTSISEAVNCSGKQVEVWRKVYSQVEKIRVNPYSALTQLSKRLTMSKYFELIKALVPIFKSRKEMDDEYLAQSIIIHDPEPSMREIDCRSKNENRGLAYALKWFEGYRR